MEILIIGMVALAVVAILVTYLGKSRSAVESEEETPSEDSEPAAECCGAHEVCEADLLAKMSTEIVYYEDQELDVFKNYEDEDYDDDQIDEFREVLYSLKEKEIDGWLHSLELRGITLPSVIKSELVFMLVQK